MDMDRVTKVLIAYDGSEPAEAAIEDLKFSGLPREAEVKVISIVESWPPSPPNSAMLGPGIAEEHSSDLDLSRDKIPRACERILSIFPSWTIDFETHGGSPASEILKKADEWKPDLIVVGSHGRSALGRLVFGSVSQRIVTEAYCSVRIGRRRVNRVASPPRIIIGVDGSINSRAAVNELARREWPEGSEARLITSIGSAELMDVSVEPRLLTPEELLKTMDLARLIQQDLENVLLPSGIKVSSVIKEGDPKQLLLAQSEEWSADCIIVGSRGLGRLKRLLLGSVSTVLAQRAHCSVEVVRATQQ
jgi:nucleotide-binding universal stress UspA family protein